METIRSHVVDLEAQLKRWGAKLDELVAKVDEVEAVSRTDRRRQLNDLRTKHKAAQKRLKRLKASGSGKWEIFKVDVDGAWTRFELALKKLSN